MLEVGKLKQQLDKFDLQQIHQYFAHVLSNYTDVLLFQFITDDTAKRFMHMPLLRDLSICHCKEIYAYATVKRFTDMPL